MATLYSPKIVMDGLVLALDAGNKKSYPGSGTSFTDLSRKGGAITIVNSPTYSSGSGGNFIFNGTTQYIDVQRSDLNAGSWAYGNLTAMIWINIDNTSSGDNNLMTAENAWEYRFINNGNGTSALAFASNPWNWIGSGNVPNGVWRMLTFRHGASTGDLFSNSTILSSTGINGAVGAGSGGQLTIMARGGGTFSFSKGQFAMAMVYGRALTNQEIFQNYDATKGRFGL